MSPISANHMRVMAILRPMRGKDSIRHRKHGPETTTNRKEYNLKPTLSEKSNTMAILPKKRKRG